MKKLILTLSATFLMHGAFALNEINQSTLTVNPGHEYSSANLYAAAEEVGNNVIWHYATDRAPDIANTSLASDIWISSGEDRWINPSTSPTNRTQSGGTTGVMRGFAPENATFYIDHVLNGRIYALGRGDLDPFTGRTTSVIGLDDPDQSKITERTAGTRARDASYADNAVTVSWGRHVDMGSWIFKEGNYYGGEGFSGGLFSDAIQLDIQGTSFVAGKFSQDYSKTLFGYNSVEANRPTGYAPSGLVAENMSSTLTISNRTGVATDRFQGGGYGQDAENIDAKINNVQYRIGGDGLTAFAVSGKTWIKGGDFIGSQQDEKTTYTVNATEFGTQG